MDIKNNSYKLSHIESDVALTGSAMLCQHESHKSDDDIQRVMRLIANSMAASRMYISARLEYNYNQSPSDETINEHCEIMENFITLPKDELTSKVLPLAIEAYFWNGHEVPGIVNSKKLEVASDMMTQLLSDSNEELN